MRGQAINDRKRCKRCMQERPIAEFHKHRGNADGLQTWCKRCQRLQDRLNAAAAAIAKVKARTEEIEARVVRGKACSTCEAVKPLDQYGVDSRKPDGRGARCKACAEPARRKAWAKYREKNAGSRATDSREVSP